ncbi:hypothetical protein RJP56_01885 [Shewanella baltica]|uniref:hypothetical protein n=1 Tax=Shewanella baltica TaxID=62322 RepID=UPI002871A2A9|nr:hypothetical protein [Shewanella baltica]MDR9764806.1 hypothetical protein [Shewanella baltica]
MKKIMLVMLVLIFQLGCESHKAEPFGDPFPPLILECLNAYKDIDGVDIAKINRIYVYYTDSNQVGVFFSRGDVGSFKKKSDDYKGILSCSGILKDKFKIYRLRNPYASQYLIDKPGFGEDIINVNTCGIVRERRYFFESGKINYQGEKIFDCH